MPSAAEIAKFDRLAQDWWDEDGAMRVLHRFNPVRLGWIRKQAERWLQCSTTAAEPLRGRAVLDVGCGGGLLAEPLARLGAQVRGVDASAKMIGIARAHAAAQGLKITYDHAQPSALAREKNRYDIVLAMEVIEHTEDPRAFVRQCARLLKPQGLLFVATLNRTARALALGIVGAEYILRWLPRGTHDWARFVAPVELKEMLDDEALECVEESGLVYRPLARIWQTANDMSINYMLCARRGG